MALPPLPEFHAVGELSGGAGEWAIKALTASLGRSDVEGGVALSMRGPVPDIRAELSSRVVDLDDLASLVGAARLVPSVPPAPRPIEPGGRVTPATSIAPSWMPGMTMEVTLRGAHMTASEVPPIDNFAVALRLEDGIVALDPMTFNVAGGEIALKASVNPLPQAPELTLDLDIRRVDLAGLTMRAPLPLFAKDARGTVGGFMRVRGAGRSLRDFLGSLDGEAGIFAENGELGPALQQLLAPDVLDALGLDGGTRTVPVSCMISRFSFKKGVVAASTLLLDTPSATLLGQGTVNFSAETIYVDITPHHKHVTSATSSTPVEVRGTYAGVTIRRGTATIVERIGGAIEPGVLPPPPALQPLVDVALGRNNACDGAFGSEKAEDAAVGSSRPPRKSRP
jgi:uncharacterized protein involved in outer membrane biogenesis